LTSLPGVPADDHGDVRQHLLVHLFAPAEGPRAGAAYGALCELWLGCRTFFLTREPLPHGGLPHLLPPAYRDLPGRAETGDEAMLAAQERPDADCQVFLRRHHDVLNLSVLLGRPPELRAPADGRSWLRDLDAQWSLLSERVAPTLLGEARVYLAQSVTPAGPWLDELLPASARIGDWRAGRAASSGPLTIWEAPPWTPERALRRLLLAYGGAEEARGMASSLAWSDGGRTAIPPLARYLLHAARLRYQYRVWRRDGAASDFSAMVRGLVDEVRQTPGARETAAGELRRHAVEARLMVADLRELRHAAEIAEHNMRLAASMAELLAADGPFASDRMLAGNFLAQLDDELRYLDIAADRVTELNDLLSQEADDRHRPVTARPEPAAKPASAAPGISAVRVPADDITKNVFVVHGRDEQARAALFGFLEELGLHPLGWETLVRATRSASPYLREVIMQGISMAQAAVVLMTPDDEVRLHPDLHGPAEDEHELLPAMQARPNVILELGMALATYADRTIVLYAGRHRPMADLSGLNYIQLSGGESLKKLVSRLIVAGCQVDEESVSRQARARFRRLAAYQRKSSPRTYLPPSP
jgi:predicted nucleotide-binding protein